MKLVIVESPTKAKTIGRFLGSDFIIKASMGHIMDLPKSTLGVDIEHNFTPLYEVSTDKKKTIAELKKLSKTASEIILATDPDREGEAIAAHIKELLDVNLKKVSGQKTKDKFVRIAFHEITKEAIEDALTHPGEVNTALVDAQTARRVLDRLVGYKLSPVLWQKIRRGLSAGRVQSVALRLIVEREREIEKFAKEPYWSISAVLSRDPAVGSPTEFDLIEISGDLPGSEARKVDVENTFHLYDGEYTSTKTIVDTQEKADAIARDLQSKTFIVQDIVQKQSKRSPQPPFTTSTLQQQAALRFGYSGKRTMSLAQKLYEEGYITYHRTDSLNLAGSAVISMREYAKEMYGEKYIPEKPRFFAGRQKNAQEAHEAIRPTKITTTAQKVGIELGADYTKLYELIWRRALASQMSDALIESTTVYVATRNKNQGVTQAEGPVDAQQNKVERASAGGAAWQDSDGNNEDVRYLFKTTGSILIFEGFLAVNPYGLEDKKLPQFSAQEILSLVEVLALSHETTPPPRYNDASLIKSLEEEGIGRPSTYASIIGTIEARQYIERQQKKFIPTSIGIAVTDFLVKNFATIDDIPFTARMEDELDEIASGEKKWVPVLQEFYTPFEEKLKEVGKAERVKIAVEETGEMCPKDGAPLVIRMGKFGKFISCQNFPTCDFKKRFIEETNFACPKDGADKGGKIIIKKTKKGRTFYGCSNYPACDFAVWKLTDLKKASETPAK